jgi:hypothetical protein
LARLYNARVRFRKLVHPVILIPLLAFVARILPGPRTIDDAYITFRYAQNLLSNQGLVYNPGEAVLGTTTPLFALILTLIGAVLGTAEAFPIIAPILNALADAIACFLLIRIGERLRTPKSGYAAALIWAVAPMSVTFAIGGMETSLFVMLMLATFYFHSSHRPVLAALTGALSLLTRPDALLFLLPIVMDRSWSWIRKKPERPSWLEVGVFFVPIVIWVIIGTHAYGTPIPHSVMAKVNAYVLSPEAGLIRFLQHYGTPFLGHLTFGNTWIGIGLILFTALYALGSITILKTKIHAWPIMIYPIVYILAFSIANPLIFRWYLVPPLPVLFLGIFAGTTRLFDDLKLPVLNYAFIAAAFLMTLNGWQIRPEHGPDRPAPGMAYIKLELLYQEAASILTERNLTNETIAAGDIGAIGYFTKAHVLDTIGLISPVSLKYYPLPDSFYTINYAIPPDLILDQMPEYVVILEVYGRNGLLINESFLDSYRLLQKIPTDIYGSNGLLIFERSAS